MLFSSSVSGNSYQTDIDASERFCLYEDVEEGKMLGLHYQVVDGGFLDIDVTVSFFILILRDF